MWLFPVPIHGGGGRFLWKTQVTKDWNGVVEQEGLLSSLVVQKDFHCTSSIEDVIMAGFQCSIRYGFLFRSKVHSIKEAPWLEGR